MARRVESGATLAVALARDSGSDARTVGIRATESATYKTRRPAPQTNPAPWRFQMARVASQFEEQGADSALFAAGFEAFPLRLGMLDLVQSNRWSSARRIGSDSGGGTASDSGQTQVLRFAHPEFCDLNDAPPCATNESSTVAFPIRRQ